MGNSYSSHTLTALLAMVLGATILAAGASLAGAQGVCSGFDRTHIITRLGGPNALGPGGLETVADLQAYFAANPDDVRSILASRGLGDEVADGLLAAVREGAGLTERPMERGETLRWMAYRKGGEIVTIENVCLRLAGSAPAFEIAVPVVTVRRGATADCTLEATTDCRPDGTGSLTVQAAPGARVVLEGPGGARTVLDGVESSWTGPMDDPSHAAHVLRVTGAAMSSETVTTYRFLVPRECVNLSLVGQTEHERPGAPVRCEERTEVSCPPPPPPPPTCTVELDRTRVRPGEPVTYSVTGRWTSLDLELRHDGLPQSQPELDRDGGVLAVSRRGDYSIVGTASDEQGDTVTCRASFEVVGADWIVRPFAAALFVDGGETGGDVFVPAGAKSCPCSPATTFGFDDGFGLGVSLERRLGERFGLEARVLYGRLDDRFWIGANGVGITDRDTADYWDLGLGLNVHLTPRRALDWYVGPFLGYGTVEGHTSLAFDRSLEYDPEGGLTWGVQMGLDWPLGAGPWALHVGARYTRYRADVVRRYTSPAGLVTEQTGALDLDPVTAELGVAYRF